MIKEAIKYLDQRTKTELIQFENTAQKAIIKCEQGKECINEKLDQEKLYSLSNDEDKIEEYNKENWQNGICIKIPKNKEKIIKINTETKNFTAHRKQIILEENSKATIIDEIKGNATTNSETIEIFLEENSKLDYIKIQDLSKETTNFTIKKTEIKKNAKLKQTNILLGGLFNIERTEIDLKDSGAETEVMDILFGEKKQHYDIATIAQHTKGNTISKINSKMALKDQSRSVYRPFIKIKPNATNSNGEQKGKILILSEEAKADPIPSLDIENNEVQCSHGIGITQIDDEKLFYLQTRGINPEKAKEEIIKGFFNQSIKDKDTEKKIKKEIEKKIKN